MKRLFERIGKAFSVIMTVIAIAVLVSVAFSLCLTIIYGSWGLGLWTMHWFFSLI